MLNVVSSLRPATAGPDTATTGTTGAFRVASADWRFTLNLPHGAVSLRIATVAAHVSRIHSGNELGSYYCFNRTYDPGQGRWTTPDPAASPWGNLQDYVGSNPLSASDPSGLAAIGTATITKKQERGFGYIWVDYEYRGKPFWVNFFDCDCCGGDIGVDWLAERMASVIGLVADLSIEADSLKRDHDKARKNNRTNYANATQWKLLTHFGSLNVGKSTKDKMVYEWHDGQTDAVHRIQEVLDDIYWFLRKDHDPTLVVRCESWGEDHASSGSASVATNPFDKNDVWPIKTANEIQLNCDHFAKDSPLETENTILHELSHLASFTDDTSDHEGKQNNAHLWGMLVEKFK